VARVFASLPEHSAATAWPDRVRRWAHDYRALALAHPNLVLRIVGDPATVAIAAQRANAALGDALHSSGLAAADQSRATDLVADYVNGFVLGEASGAMNRATADAGFAFGLDVILAGLTQRQRTGRRPGI
jgi:tetracycline repressor-like protein